MASNFVLKINGRVDASQIQKDLSKMTPTITVQTVLKGGGTKAVTTYSDAVNNTVKVTKEFNSQNQLVAEGISRVSVNAEKATTKIGQLGKDFLTTTTKVLQFGASTAVIGLFTAACGSAVTAVKELDDSLTEFKKVSDLSGDSLQEYVNKLTQMGELTGSTAKQMVDAATEFKKSGYSDEDSAKLAQIAELYMNIADEQLTAGDSASFIISQMKAFNITAEDSIHIIDAVNEVSNDYAVSSADLADNIGKVSSTLASSGNSYEQTLGMLTAITEITRNASTASRGLKQISSRLVQTVDETSSIGQKLTTIYTKLGISLKDSDGQLRSTYDILKDLSAKWNTLSSDQQNYIALTSAGSNQVQNFQALMANFSTAITATDTAYNSTGSAMEENGKAMESLSKKINLLKSSFDSMVNEGGTLNSFFKIIITGTTYLLKFVNDAGLLQVALVALGGVLVSKVISGFTLLGTKLASMVANFDVAYTATGNFGGALKVMVGESESAAVAMSALNIAIAGVAAAISLGIIAYNLYINKQREAKQNRQDSIDTSQKEIQSLNDAETQLKSETLTREELDKIVSSNLSSYSDEISKISDLNKARQEAIDKIEDQKKAEAQNIVDTGQTDYESALSRRTDSGQSKLNMSPVYSSSFSKESNAVENAKGITNTVSALKDYKEALLDARSEIDNNSYAYGTYSKEISNVEAEIARLEKQQSADNDTIKEYNRALAEAGEYYDTVTGQVKELSDAEENNRTAISEASDAMNDNADASDSTAQASDLTDTALEDMAKALGMSTEELESNAETMGMTAEEYANFATNSKDISNDISTTSGAIDDLQSALSTCQEALTEYNTNGQVSVDTFQALMNIAPQYLGALQDQSGQLVINKETLTSYIEQLKISKIQQLQSAATADILKLAQGDVADMSDTAKTAIQGVGDKSDSASTQMGTAAQQAEILAQTLQDVADGAAGKLKGSGTNVSDFKAKSGAIISAYSNIAKQIGNLKVDFNDVGSSSSKSSKSASDSAKKAAEEAEKAYKESVEQKQKFIENQYKTGKISEKEYLKELYALNESYYGKLSGKGTKYLDEYEKNQQSIYDGIKDLAKASVEATEKSMQKQIDAVDKEEDAALDAIDKQIDAVKDAEDAALKAIENQIDSLKDEKEDALNAIQDQIDALKKQKDAEDKYWDDRIDKLKAANTELSNQNQLMEYQQALAQAQQSKVMILGSSGKFEYQQDQSSVSSAEKTLNDYQDQLDYEKQLQELEDYKEAADENYEAQIQALEDLKDAKEDWYDEQIEDLENYKDSVQEQYDAQIEQLNDYKDQVQEQYDAQKQMLQDQLDNYKDHEDELIAKQVEAITAESANWQTRLNNLQSFVNSYNAMLASLGEAGASVSSSYKASKATSKSSSSKKSTKKHASGVASIASDETALVGDSPNQELVVGSKINGSIMNLPKGSGVVNAQSTKTLAGLINTLGSTLGVGNYNTVNTANTRSTSITISNLNVSSENGEELVNYLQNFGMQMTQDAYAY